MNKLYFPTLLSCLMPLLGLAQWNSNTSINTPACLKIKSQSNLHAVTDGFSGIIMAWDDNRDTSATLGDVYAQRLDKNGLAKWTLNGVAVCANQSTQKSSAIVESNNGSSIITWADDRNGDFDIYAQKLDSNGNPLWTSGGVALTSSSNTSKNPKIVVDNSGGAYVVWEDSTNVYYDIYVQHINSSGANQLGINGLVICNANNSQINPKIDSDFSGGAIITWQDKRNGNDYDIYAQRIASGGAVSWAANGVVICNAVNTQSNPRIEPDGNGGATIAWVDKRSSSNSDIYAQNINASGAVSWAANGVVVCNAAGNQSAVDMKFVGTSGTLVSWKDFRNNTYQIYSQLVNLQGAVQLAANGIQLSSGLKAINPNTINSGNGNAIVVWQDSSAAGWDIKAQQITNSLTIGWAAGGVIVSNASDNQINATNVSDGIGGAIFAWEDRRNGNDYDLYAHHIDINGMSLVTGEELSYPPTYLKAFPNPITESNTVLNISTNLKSTSNVEIFNVFGQRIEKGITNAFGEYTTNTNQLPNGLYNFRINGTQHGSFIIAK